ncbi:MULTISPECIES: CehA/McbA family metallohydrolase [Haloferax]|uniref:PHP domain-containing protein n=5 Tax=Halobacteriales TaxID=2235 RepID=A0A6C0UUT5_HALVO|nr:MULTISPECIES: PHP domain-containing protein [Haloferax]MBC9986960.1 PHP domain-containing protein [Haloferax sp. AS1]ELZ75640.1 PHP domain-containing protein [Haloferax lucentense DSM 14919]ELZ88082.1 PHP domain-containing protein [Haloferax alexandrinus JCM 10717]NLV03798.1 PHP domain-containing protein [Haloferax alexandrinus]QIB79264.1 PHP domain-containing protein [Haloferax alexandrinus]
MSALTVRIDPHVHSEGSYDAHDPVELILEQAAEIGLDAVVVTDHDVIDESLRAAQLAPMYGLVGIPGVEVSTADGHLLALGVEELPPRRRPLDETARWVRERGGVAIVPHPFQRSRHGIGRRRLGRYHDAAGGDAFDAIETYNSWLFTGYKNRRARRFAAKRQYPGVAGSDAHRVGYVGRAYTEIDIPDVSRASLTADDILTAIRSGSTEVQGRRTPIPTSTKHYAGAAGRKSAYYAKRGALGSALLAKKGAFKSGYYAKLGALKSGSIAKTGVAQAARMLYRLSPLSR